MGTLTPSDLDRFWAKVYLDTVGHGCWEWASAKMGGGYGAFWLKSARAAKAHRVSYEIENGPISAGLVVRHLCNNPGCVRPSHLAVGTALDNAADRDRSGRTARGDRAGLRLHPERAARGLRNGAYTHPERIRRGADNHKVTASDETVATVVATYRAGGKTLTELAVSYGISVATVHRWVRGRTRAR